MTQITVLPILEDNYAYLIETNDGHVAVIDPGSAEPVIEVLEAKGLKLDFIINTHHHWDHVNGNIKLKEKYGAIIIGPEAEREKIKNMDKGISEASGLQIDDLALQVIETPGHTLGGICLYAPTEGVLFTGDSLFSMGCGRLFEGTAEQLWNGFQKLLALPDDTMIYPGHEYTLSNGKFCAHIEPENTDIAERMDEVRALRDAGKPTIPVSLATEKKTNVFLKSKSPEAFAQLRSQKDQF